jgi:alpha/beta superfamily hydrolase
MLIDFTAAQRQPVLDVVAEKEFKEVVATAPLRKARLPKDACSRDLTIAGADHYFDRRQQELAAAVATFLERVFAGRC